MDKLEYKIVTLFQEIVNSSDSVVTDPVRYIKQDGELIAVLKGPEEKDLFISTECNLNNMGSDLFVLKKLTDTLYRVTWTPVFDYLVGEIDDNQIDKALLTKELKLLRVSQKPLSNFLRSK